MARLLTGALPRVEVVKLDGLGHMGPTTHPQPFNEAIADFLARKFPAQGRQTQFGVTAASA